MRKPFLTTFTVLFFLCALAAPAIHAGTGGKSNGHRHAKGLENGNAQNDDGSTRRHERALERDNDAMEGGRGKRDDGEYGENGDNAPEGKGSYSDDDAGSPGRGRGKGGIRGGGDDD